MRASWHHSSLAVADLQASAAFYEAMFGFKPLFEASLTKEISAITAQQGLTCDLMQLQRTGETAVLELIAFNTEKASGLERPTVSGAAHLSFVVEDLAAATRELQRLGGKVLGQSVDFSEGRSVYCQEPGGSFIELEELKEG